MKIQKLSFTLCISAVLLAACLFYCLGIHLDSLSYKPQLPVTELQTEHGTTMQTVSITDIQGCHKLPSHALNIVQGAFLSNSNPTEVHYTEEALGNRGTIQILVTNLDPMDPEYSTKAERLNWLKDNVDNNYHLALYLPPIASAVNVYARVQLLGSVGAIAEYDFVDFYNISKKTVFHENATEPLLLDLTMFQDRKFLGAESPMHNGVLVTIHYEAPEGKTAFLDGDILLGDVDSVTRVVQRRSHVLSLLQILAIAMVAIFLFVSFLERKRDFISHTLLVLSIAGIYTTYLLSSGYVSHPYLLRAITEFCIGLVGVSIALSLRHSWKGFPLRAAMCILASAAMLLGTLLPFASHAMHALLAPTVKGLYLLLCLALPTLLLIDTAAGRKQHSDIGNMVAVVFLAAAVFSPSPFSLTSPLFLLSILLLSVTVYLGFREFVLTKRHDIYLTNNLKAEVERQTEHLSRMVGERDDLLRYIAHDLRKPILYVKNRLSEFPADTAQERNTALQSISSKLEHVDRSFLEISEYFRSDYHVELSKITHLGNLLQDLHAALNPDCHASGVLLRVQKADWNVFIKPNALNSILENLILNALDHAKCTQIDVVAQKRGGNCLISVLDNGIGVKDEASLFLPYQSQDEEKNGNLGIGLYIARQFARSMGGDLTYERSGDCVSVFTVTIPIV